MQTMRTTIGAALLALGAFSVSGCSTLTGAAVGGAAGAGVAAATDHDVKTGAAVGAVTGGVIGTVAD